MPEQVFMHAQQAPDIEAIDTGVCFHCGLDVPPDALGYRLEVLGAPRQFCCAGCHAVCDAIVQSGLEDYYQYREKAPAGEVQAQMVPEFLQKLSVYDRPEVQKGFVSHSGTSREASLLLEDIRCPACLWLNEKHLRGMPGILDVRIDHATRRMRVRWDPEQLELSNILGAIAQIGYVAHPYNAERSEQLEKVRTRRSLERIIFAAIMSMMVMNFSIATYVMGGPDDQGNLELWEIIGRWTGLFVCSTLLVYPAQEFWVGAWHDLRNRRLGMDIPIVLGLSIAYLASLYHTFYQQGEVYLDSIAMFVLFVLLARHFETRGRVQVVDSLDRMNRAIPEFAHLQGSDGVIDTPVFDLQVGDRILVYPGERVPVDGIIDDGESSFDESLITGESEPVLHALQDRVIAGSVNREQPVTVLVKKVGDATTIARMQRLVEQGMRDKPKASLLADVAARWFVSAVLLVAMCTAAYWYLQGSEAWVANTIAVLIVTCPCALSLATPMSLIMGAGLFVKAGVLPLHMSALSFLARVRRFAFDKTGTLTEGCLRLVDVIPLNTLSKAECIDRAAALSMKSEHPVARVLREQDITRNLQARGLRNAAGNGVAAEIDGVDTLFGKPEFALRSPVAQSVYDRVAEAQGQGMTVSILSANGVALAIFLFRDRARTDATETLADLKRLGIKDLSLLSGDAASSARALARELGIADCHGGMLPEDKVNWLKERQRDGQPIAMVGDGLNDAPVLATAAVSLSMSQATDLANAHSDFVLSNNRLSAIPAAIRISRAVHGNIRQNLFWAVAYNIVAVPLAAMGYVPPWLAAIGMSASSLVVVLNALRLKKPRYIS